MATQAAIPTLHDATTTTTVPRRRASDWGRVRHDNEAKQQTRDATFKRALALADIFAAAAALALSIQVVGDDRLRLATLAGLPLVVVVSKIIGLYDRDELVLNKSTLDEMPKLFTLAAMYTLSIDILSSALITGKLGRDQLLGMWVLFFVTVLAGRSMARAI